MRKSWSDVSTSFWLCVLAAFTLVGLSHVATVGAPLAFVVVVLVFAPLWLCLGAAAVHQRRSRSKALNLEGLEERAVPAAYQVTTLADDPHNL